MKKLRYFYLLFGLGLCVAVFYVVASVFCQCPECREKTPSPSLAQIARDTAPWTMPDDIFRNYVAPDTSVDEELDDWRPMFRERFLPLVKDCKTTTDAAETLNLRIWEILGVKYSPERDKPDQSPFHSMRIGKASCTGLSILLIDACRSVGVPARFVGCRWKNKPGNHSWVEIWDNGEWKHLGAGDGGSANKTWFDADAAHADPDDPRFAIYAACVDPTGMTFPAAWKMPGTETNIPAINVTARYLLNARKPAEGMSFVSLDLRDASGKRVVSELVVYDAQSGEILARGKSHDNRYDLNDHLRVELPTQRLVRVVLGGATERELSVFRVEPEEQVVRLKRGD